jgi:transposase/quinol monooxygenase YgiN
MIIRVFAARLKPGARPAYERLCREKSAPTMRRQPGFLAYHIPDALPDRPDDFVFVSVWKDVESIRAFIGDRWQEVLIIPGEADMLEAADVYHYDESYASLIQMSHATADRVKQREVAATTAPLGDAEWERIRPLIPPGRLGGRPRLDDRRTLDGILYVLRTGCAWRELPREYGSPVTCWRRFAAWQADGTWERIWRELLATLDAPGRLAWALAFLDGRSVPTTRRRRLIHRERAAAVR